MFVLQWDAVERAAGFFAVERAAGFFAVERAAGFFVSEILRERNREKVGVDLFVESSLFPVTNKDFHTMEHLGFLVLWFVEVAFNGGG